jgi:hypothetical protein
MDHHLAGEDGAGNTRNGYGRKTVMTDTGKLAPTSVTLWRRRCQPAA